MFLPRKQIIRSAAKYRHQLFKIFQINLHLSKSIPSVMTKPRLALFLGILCISIFPVIVRMALTPALTSAFYRMAIASALLLPVALWTGYLKFNLRRWLPMIALCGVLFAADIAVWNIAIQHSSATQATLLTNLSPIWVGVISFFFLNYRPRKSFWLGTAIAVAGMIIFVGTETITELRLDAAFFLALLSGLLYALYILASKRVLEKLPVISFISVSMLCSTFFLLLVCLISGAPLHGFSQQGWISLGVQGVVCQLIAWLLISYATQRMRATRVSLSLLSQAIFAAVLATIFVDEIITPIQVAGSAVILAGIATTFYEKKNPV